MCKKLYQHKEKQKPPKFQSVRIAVRIGFMNGRLKYMVYKIPQGKNGENIRMKAENNPDVFLFHIMHDKVVRYVPLPKKKRKPGVNKRLLQNKYSKQKFSRPIMKNLRFQKGTGLENLKSIKKMPGSKFSKTNIASKSVKFDGKKPASKLLIDGIKKQSSIERKPKGTEPPAGKAGGKRQQAPTGRIIKRSSKATNTNIVLTSAKVGSKKRAKSQVSKQQDVGSKNQPSIERKPKNPEPPAGKAGGKKPKSPTGRGIPGSFKATSLTSAKVGGEKQEKSPASKKQDDASKVRSSIERKLKNPEPPAGKAGGKKSRGTNTVTTSAKVGSEKQQEKLPASKQLDDASKKELSNERKPKGPVPPTGKAGGKKQQSPTVPGASKATSTNIAATSAKVGGEKQGKSPASKKQDDASKIQSSIERKPKGPEAPAGKAGGKTRLSLTAATSITSAKVGGEKQGKSPASKKQDDASKIQSSIERKPKGPEAPAGKAGGKTRLSLTAATSITSAKVGGEKQGKSPAPKKRDNGSQTQSSIERKPKGPEAPAGKAGGKTRLSLTATNTKIVSTSATVGGEKQGKSPASKKQDDATKIQSSSERKPKGPEAPAGKAEGKTRLSLTAATSITSAKVGGEKQAKSLAAKKQVDASKIQSSIERKPKGPEAPAGKAGGKTRLSLTAATSITSAKVGGEKQAKSLAAKKQDDASKIQSSSERKPKGPEAPAGKAGGMRRQPLNATSLTSAKVGGEKQGKSPATKRRDIASQTQSSRVKKQNGPETPAGKAGSKRPQLPTSKGILRISKGTNTNIVSTSAKVGGKMQAIPTKTKTGQLSLTGKKPALKQRGDASKKLSSRKGKPKSPKPRAGKAGRKKRKLRTVRGVSGYLKNSVVRLDKLMNLIPTKKQIIRRPQLRKIPFAKILKLAEKKGAKMNAPSKGQIAKIPVVPIRKLVQVIFKPVFNFKGNYCYPVTQLSKMLRFEIERPKNAKSKVDLSLILNMIEAKQHVLRKLRARKRHRALIRRALIVKRRRRLRRNLEKSYGKGKVPHRILARTLYAEMRTKSIPKSLKGKQMYKKLLKKNLRKFKAKGRGVTKKKYLRKLLRERQSKGQPKKKILYNDRRTYLQQVTKEIAKNALKEQLKAGLKKPAPSPKKIEEPKMPKKVVLIPPIKPPAPRKEVPVPEVGPVVKLVLNRYTKDNNLIVETIIFEDILGLFSANLKHSKLNLAESRRILTLMERFKCVNGQYNNTLFMVNNCTFYNTTTRNFVSQPYISSLRNSNKLKNYLDKFDKESSATSLVPTCTPSSPVSTEFGSSKVSSTSMTSSPTMVTTSNKESSSDKQVVKKALDDTIDSFVAEPTMVEEVVQKISKPAKVPKLETPVIETKAADFKQRFKNSLIMKKIFQIRQTPKKSKTFLLEDASPSSSYKRVRVVARQKLDESEKSVACISPDTAKANVCEVCGCIICKNCFGRIMWVPRKLSKSQSQRKKSKQVYVQECLCKDDLADYRYKVMLLKYHHWICYNCFLVTIDHINGNRGKVRFLDEYRKFTNNQEVDRRTSLTEERCYTSSQSNAALSTSSLPFGSNCTSFMFDTSMEGESRTFSVLKSDSQRKSPEEDGRRSTTDTGLKSILKKSGHGSVATENGKRSSDKSYRSSKKSGRKVSFLENYGISSGEKTLSFASNNVEDKVIPKSEKEAVMKYQKQSKAKAKHPLNSM